MNINKINPSHKVLWLGFKNYCHNNGIEVDDLWEDVEPWWNIYLAGATAMYLKIKSKEIDV